MGCRPWFWTVNRNQEWLSPQNAACGYGPEGMKGRLHNGAGGVMEVEGEKEGREGRREEGRDKEKGGRGEEKAGQ